MWPTTIAEAQAIQEQLRTQVIERDEIGTLRTVAGIDAGYQDDVALAAVVVLSFPGLRPLASAVARRPVAFPYVPGYLSFRETPAVLDALAHLAEPPDVLICDGQGRAHPRRFGIACHIGVLTGIPTIGCAKSLLIGRHAPLGDTRGATVPLLDQGEQIGVVLRTRSGTRPVYVSVGHRVSLERAVELVLACTTRYRLPETTRAADGLASHGRVPVVDP